MTTYDPIYLTETEHSLLDHSDVPGVPQGGASVWGVDCFLTHDGYASGASGVLIPSLTMSAGSVPTLTLHSGPNVVGAGGKVGEVFFYSPEDTVVRLELHISNAAGSIWGYFYSDAELAIVGGVARDFTLADWDGAGNIVGGDLSIRADGAIISAAGGAFSAQAIIYSVP